MAEDTDMPRGLQDAILATENRLGPPANGFLRDGFDDPLEWEAARHAHDDAEFMRRQATYEIWEKQKHDEEMQRADQERRKEAERKAEEWERRTMEKEERQQQSDRVDEREAARPSEQKRARQKEEAEEVASSEEENRRARRRRMDVRRAEAKANITIYSACFRCTIRVPDYND